MNNRSFIGVSSAMAALIIAMLSAWVSLRQEVFARPGEAQVRQLIDDKTTDKFFEVFRRFDKLESQLDRLNTELVRRNETNLDRQYHK